MALIKCDECGRSVSNQAASCPGCGAPIRGASAVARPGLSQHQVKMAVQKGSKHSAFQQGLGNTIGFFSVAVGIVVALFGAGTAGLMVCLVGGGVGLWIAYA